jgi:hypothetical protein
MSPSGSTEYAIGDEDSAGIIIHDDNSRIVYSDTQLSAATPVSITSGVAATNQVVATFTDSDTARTAAYYTAVIDWGDGTGSSPATVGLVSAGRFQVFGTHTFAQAGVFPVTVTVTANYFHNPGDPDPTQIVYSRDVVTHLTAVVDPATPGPTLTGVPLSVTAGQALPGQNGETTIATFGGDPSDPTRYTAEVFLGTGGPSIAGDVVDNPNPAVGGLLVLIPSDPDYEVPGTYVVRVLVRDSAVDTEPGGALVATADAVVTVAPAAPTLPGLTDNPVQLSELVDRTGLVVASFSSAQSTANLRAQIDWGDGTAPQGASFSVNGSQVTVVAPSGQYHAPGSYGVTVTFTNATTGAVLGQVATTALVSALGLTADPSVPTAIERVSGLNGVGDYLVAGFQSADTEDTAPSPQEICAS